MTYSEEVAFNDPPAGGAERLILNQHLRRLLAHTKLSAFQRFVQGVRALPEELAPRSRCRFSIPS